MAIIRLTGGWTYLSPGGLPAGGAELCIPLRKAQLLYEGHRFCIGYIVWFLTEAHSGETQLVAMFFEIRTEHISEFDVFEIAQNTLIWIEIGRIAWQPFQMDAPDATRR